MVATNLFKIYLISRFIHIFLDNEENEKCDQKMRHMLVYLGFFLVNMAVYLTFNIAWVNIACNLVGIGLIVLTYTKSIKTILFITCSIYMINAGCETIAILLFVNNKNAMVFNQIYKLIQMFLLLICEVFTEKIIGTQHKTKNVRNLSLALTTLCSMGMLCLMIYTGSSTQIGLVIVSIGLFLVNFFIVFLYNMLSDAFVYQYENEMLRRTIQCYSNQLDIILQEEEKVKALRHDMKHHMNELKILAAKNESREIEKYIDDMKKFIANSDEIVSSGNIEIDSVMNYLLIKAKQELHIVNTNVRLPKTVGHSFDINVILGNLLENGIEAARQTEEKRLDVSIELQQGVLWIQIENSYNGKLEKKHQKLLTTKKEKGIHGMRLENVAQAIICKLLH